MSIQFFNKIKEINHDYCMTLIFSPDSKFLIAGGTKDILIYESQNFEQVYILKGHSTYIRDLLFYPCGKVLVSASDDKSIIFWEFKTKTIIK